MELLASAAGHLTGPDYQVQITSGNHSFLADEPLALQGADTGPDPYSLLLSALVSCTSITLKMYAGRKGWPLEDAEVECRLTRADAAARPEIERVIILKGDLNEEQKQRLLQIASACPVHKMLSSGNTIHSRLELPG
jgi:putative redox protein